VELFSLSLISVILVVAVFDFTNGFHDAADMVATAIASRAMKPATAIMIVSSFTFLAPFTVGLAEANQRHTGHYQRPPKGLY
jgi:PiT family inorganic phosphate transporter